MRVRARIFRAFTIPVHIYLYTVAKLTSNNFATSLGDK